MFPQKDLSAILAKLGIEQLNDMQEAAMEVILHRSEVVLISPTGSGKTLAFLLPVMAQLQAEVSGVQVLIVVPTRELAIQIDQVVRSMGSGWRCAAMYGGQSGSKDKADLKNPPTILIGTPGRIADHLRRGHLIADHLHTLILDEYDKSLEVGFSVEMADIVHSLPRLERKILTSATRRASLPEWVKMQSPAELVFEAEEANRLQIFVVPAVDKMESLVQLLYHLGTTRGILFCNMKENIRQLQETLNKHLLPHVCFHGDMEQQDREKALIQFRNGSYRILLATDLAARGIDVPELDYIIHYQLPGKEKEFIHRNGRTARMHASGTAYVLHQVQTRLPDYLEEINSFRIPMATTPPPPTEMATLCISAGRKDKISKGDIAGFLHTAGSLLAEDVGRIELQRESSFAAVARLRIKDVLPMLNGQKLKGRKVKVSVLN